MVSRGRLRFDHCMALVHRERGTNAGQEVECVVQVRALFWCTVNGSPEQFAFVYEMNKEPVINTVDNTGAGGKRYLPPSYNGGTTSTRRCKQRNSPTPRSHQVYFTGSV